MRDRWARAFLPVMLIGQFASCGGGDNGSSNNTPSTADPADAFVGTWKVNGTRTLTVDCAGTAIPAAVLGSQVNVDLTWSKGTDGALVGTLLGCTFKASVSGKVATALPSQACMVTILSATLSSYSFTLGADGKTATDSASGSGTTNSLGSTTCSFTESGKYDKS